MLGYPSPAIFLYEEISPEGDVKYAVVDGKQRLTAALEFSSNLFPVGDKSSIERTRGLFFENLNDDARKQFWTYQFAVEYLSTTDEGTLNNIFDRINRNVARLTPQELRHAKYSGEFASSSESLTEYMDTVLPSEFPRIIAASKRQMKDVELVSQLLLFLADGVAAYSQADLDAAYAERDEEWQERVQIEREFREVVDLLNEIPYEVLTAPPTRRIRNQADFYSLFAAIATLKRSNELPDAHNRNQRLAEFLTVVNDDAQRVANSDASRYYDAARSASNDATPRAIRLDIMTNVLRGEWKRASS